MSRVTGIHVSGRILRLVCLEAGPDGLHLRALLEASLPLEFRSEVLRDPNARNGLVKGIEETVSSIDEDLGVVVTCLNGGLYHIQKVPLEVASAEDQRDQIDWEASQALISPRVDYIVDFYPAGRVAFWVALRREVVDLCTDIYASAGISVSLFQVEPIALFYACQMAGVWTGDPRAAILIGNPWLSFIAAKNTTLTAAETVSVDCRLPDEPFEKNGRGPRVLEQQGRFEITRQWIYGDLSPDLRRPIYEEVFFCGEQEQTLPLVRLFENETPKMRALNPLSACEVEGLKASNRQFLRHESSFSIAAGLAYRGLERDSS